MTRTLYLTVSGASTTDEETIPDLVRLLTAEGWDITVVSTPTGTHFHDPAALEEATGRPVRTEFRMPGTGTRLVPGGAVLACPWSFNSTNKTAYGIADTFAVALVCEMIGHGVPTVIVPKAGAPLARHPAFGRSMTELASMEPVTVLYDPDRRLPSWHEVVAALSAAAR
ncbi:flavoprotein [Nocardiopsis sp. CNT-189]|uniref:flavoprotein n=1 Tax=Nocardiopsis oceanisediminis TaxID=2816862 RepID=UPI003B316607